jgi:hypothetical protein
LRVQLIFVSDPMPKIVLVHGIGQQHKSSDLLESEWLPALAGGLRNAGYPVEADRIWHERGEAQVVVRMAFYGDLFLAQGQMGLAEPAHSLEDTRFAEALANEWLLRAAERSPTEGERRSAHIELAYLRENGGLSQGGIRMQARSAVASLAKLRWFAPYGMALAERFVFSALNQVTSYLTDDLIRAKALKRLEDILDSDTQVIIAHSLGSILAYECLCASQRPLPLLITLGSPLGIRTVIYDRLRPQPPAFPSVVANWINVADSNDIVAAESDISNMFANGLPAQARFDASVLVDNGSSPHSAVHYLGKIQVGRAVGEILAGSAQRTTDGASGQN